MRGLGVGRCATNFDYIKLNASVSPNLQLDESLIQKVASLSTGYDNNEDHNQLDNIEGQTSVKLQQTVNDPRIRPSLKNKRRVTFNLHVDPEESNNTLPSYTPGTIKGREEPEEYGAFYNKENIPISPELEKHEEWCGPNNEPPSFSLIDSSYVSPHLPSRRPLFKRNSPNTKGKRRLEKALHRGSINDSIKETSSDHDDVFDKEIEKFSNINLGGVKKKEQQKKYGTSYKKENKHVSPELEKH
uniref:Uncharacterized protein n=1 Tax=Timema cristinae TaxID=61476 RepID=A0A7R9H6Q1_TIMCR|nr:unnamed protein product [Timema cristinae]